MNRGALGIVEDDEIDVARIVELARAVLAEREHHQAAARFNRRALRDRGASRPLARGSPQQKAQRRADRRVGEPR